MKRTSTRYTHGCIAAIRTLFGNIWINRSSTDVHSHTCGLHARDNKTRICSDRRIGSKNDIIMNFIDATSQLLVSCPRLMNELETNHSVSLLLWKSNTRRVIWGFCDRGKLRDRSQVVNGETGQAMNNQCSGDTKRIISDERWKKYIVSYLSYLNGEKF